MFLTETQYFHLKEDLSLESGKILKGVRIAYETYGELSPDKDNAVLICHPLSGDAHAAGKYSEKDKKPGWWDVLIGPGKAIDTDKFFVICSNVIGGCSGSTGPTDIDPDTGKPYGMNFPFVTIHDMVDAQRRLIDSFDIDVLYAVVGGSMGGMQALSWVKKYPDRVVNCIAIATALYQSAQNIALHEVGRRSIVSDPHYKEGYYYGEEADPDEGLAIARMIGHITYLSDKAFQKKFGRGLQNMDKPLFDMHDQYKVESYLGYQGRRFIERFDANSYIYITRAIDYFDIGYYVSMHEIFKNVKTRFLVLSFTSDWLYPPQQMQEVVSACKVHNIPVTYYNIPSDAGHDSFLLKNDTMESAVKNFLEQYYCREYGNQTVRVIDEIRLDHQIIFDEIPEHSSVLDLGCGDGTLLQLLEEKKDCPVQGVELDKDNFTKCVSAGIDVIEADIEEVLFDYQDASFDYVVLNLSLQVTKNSKFVMDEALRVGKKVIVSFPNFGHILNIVWLIFKWTMPKSHSLPYEWYETPNIHLLTIKDFENLCKQQGYKIIKQHYYNDKNHFNFLHDWFARYSMHILEKQ